MHFKPQFLTLHIFLVFSHFWGSACCCLGQDPVWCKIYMKMANTTFFWFILEESQVDFSFCRILRSFSESGLQFRIRLDYKRTSVHQLYWMLFLVTIAARHVLKKIITPYYISILHFQRIGTSPILS